MPLVECSICLNPYDDNRRPVVGTCGHSFCGECIQKYNGSCPACRKVDSFSHPVNNYLAAEMNEQLISSVHSLERRQGVINDLENQVLEKDEMIRRDMAKADELGQLQQRVEELQLRNSELTEQLRRSEQLAEQLKRSEQLAKHYKNQCERAKLDIDQLKNRNSHLEDEQAGFLRREAEHERILKERDDWDTLEGIEEMNMPQPENIAMILPAMKFISDDTKKHLTDLGIVLIHRADLTSRQLIAASQKQYHETVVPLMNNLVKKAGEIIVQAQQERRN